MSIAGLCEGLADVTFPDPNLEAAVRLSLDVPTDPLTCSNLALLSTLDASALEITDLSGLECATNLTALNLSGNEITELTPLQGLHQIQLLRVSNNRLTGISPLTLLTNLSSLSIGGNAIHDYSPLSNLHGLKSVAIRGGSMKDLTVLGNLDRLRSLDLFGNRVTRLLPLVSLTNLTCLDVGWNPITDHDVALATATNLISLSVGGNSLTNAGFVQNLVGLTSLNMADNGLTDLSPLTTLTQLTHLGLSGNPITNYAAVSALTNLEVLELRGNAITNLAFLSGLNRLGYIDLASNSITDLGPLALLPNLGGVVLDQNPITNYAVLTNVASLRALWFDGQPDGDLSFLQNLPELETISLRKCRLMSLAVLQPLTNVASVYVDFNRLTNISVLGALPELARAALVGNLLETNAGSPVAQVIDGLTNQGVAVSYVPQSQPPQIIAPAEWFVARDQPATLPVLVADSLDPTDSLPITVNSSNPGVIPTEGLVIAGGGHFRTLTVTASTNATGRSTLVLTVVNEACLTSTATIAVDVVEPVNVTNLLAPGVTGLDPAFEAALRLAAGNHDTDLTSVDLLRMTTLLLNGAIPEGFDGWAWCSNLTSLVLSGTALTEAGFLTNLTQLTHLWVVDTSITNLPIGELPRLEWLYCSGLPIHDLSFLEGSPGLTHLTCVQSALTDISPLMALTNLADLNVSYNLLTNLQPLSALPALSSVDVTLNLLDLGVGSSNLAVVNALKGRGVFVVSLPQRGPPVFDITSNWFIGADQVSTLSFGLGDNSGTPFSGFSVGSSSSNPELLPDSGVFISADASSSLTEWQLTVAPSPGASGSTTVTLNATNDAGLASSRLVNITVSRPLEIADPLLGMSSLVWRSGSAVPWFGQTGVTHRGFATAQSGNIVHGNRSILETEVIGPGTFGFWWKVSSETNADWLVVETAFVTNRISGEVDWQKRMVPVEPGTQRVRWRYNKNFGVSGGADAGWVAQVEFVPAVWLDLLGAPVQGTSSLDLYGVLDRSYEIQVSTNLTDWEPLTTVASTNRIVTLSDPTATNSARFYRAKEQDGPVLEFLIDFGGSELPTLHGPPPDDPDHHWNNVTTDVGGIAGGQLSGLVTVSNTATSVDLVMLSPFSGRSLSGTSSSSVFPWKATTDTLFGNTEAFEGRANVFPRFKLTGLDPALHYSFTFYASRVAVSDNRETEYTVTGSSTNSVALDPVNNLDTVAMLNDVLATAEGEITIGLAPTTNNNNQYHFTYLGVLRVEGH